MMGLHVEGRLFCATKTHVGYMWRSIRNVTKKHTSYTWNIARNLNLNFIKETCPHPGMVLWIRIGVKHVHQNVPADHLTGLHRPS